MATRPQRPLQDRLLRAARPPGFLPAQVQHTRTFILAGHTYTGGDPCERIARENADMHDRRKNPRREDGLRCARGDYRFNVAAGYRHQILATHAHGPLPAR